MFTNQLPFSVGKNLKQNFGSFGRFFPSFLFSAEVQQGRTNRMGNVCRGKTFAGVVGDRDRKNSVNYFC